MELVRLVGDLLNLVRDDVLQVRAAFESQNSEAVLQVDATNAFNCLNRQAALRNISVICPSFVRVLINTYLVDSLLYTDGNHILS